MVIIPSHFVPIKYPGYYWNVKDHQLYSIKIDGVLKPLQRAHPCRWNHWKDGFKVSVRGHRRFIPINDLLSIKAPDGNLLDVLAVLNPTAINIFPIKENTVGRKEKTK